MGPLAPSQDVSYLPSPPCWKFFSSAVIKIQHHLWHRLLSGDFFFSLSCTCQWQYTHKTQDSMFKSRMLPQVEITLLCIFPTLLYLFLFTSYLPAHSSYWLFYSQLSLSKWRVISTLETQAIYRKNHCTSICSFPSYNFKKYGKCSTVSD